MSYTHIHLRNLQELELELQLNPERIHYYAKYGGYIGSTESVEFLRSKLKSYDPPIQYFRYTDKGLERT